MKKRKKMIVTDFIYTQAVETIGGETDGERGIVFKFNGLKPIFITRRDAIEICKSIRKSIVDLDASK
jgi:hypothetical protein